MLCIARLSATYLSRKLLASISNRRAYSGEWEPTVVKTRDRDHGTFEAFYEEVWIAPKRRKKWQQVHSSDEGKPMTFMAT